MKVLEAAGMLTQANLPGQARESGVLKPDMAGQEQVSVQWVGSFS
jgi:hypothetical protein